MLPTEASRRQALRTLAADLLPTLPSSAGKDPAQAVIRLRGDAGQLLRTIHDATRGLFGRPLSANALIRLAINDLGRRTLNAQRDEALQEPLLRDMAQAAQRLPYKPRRKQAPANAAGVSL